MWIEYNPNPTGRKVGDCSVRAVSKALGVDWETAFAMISANAYAMGDMPSSDSVWGATLRQNGFYRESIPNTCPDCYTLRDFCAMHPYGKYLACTGSHVVAVIDGDYYDTWDSGDETILYYFRKARIIKR